MSNYLQLSHWLDEVVSTLQGDAGIFALGYSSNNIMVMDQGFFSDIGALNTRLPAILVSYSSPLITTYEEITHQFEVYNLLIRILSIQHYQVGTQPYSTKMDHLSTIHGALVDVTTSTSWTLPGGGWEGAVHHSTMQAIDDTPSEEQELRDALGESGPVVVAVACTINLEFRAKVT